MIRITEDSLKPEIKSVLERIFGSGCVTETTTSSGKIDLYLRVTSYRVVVEVKIGGIGKLTEAIVQASNYASDMRADGTIVLLYPTDIRLEFSSSRVDDAARAIHSIVHESPVTALVLTPFWNTRFDGTLPSLAAQMLTRATQPHLTDPALLVEALRQGTLEISSKLRGRSRQPLIHEVAASLNLFAELSGEGEKPAEAEGLIGDLAAHIFVNQVLLYHLLATARVHEGLTALRQLDRLRDLHTQFAAVTKIDYRAIYRIDILDKLPDSLLPIVNRIILALKVLRPESIPHDLFGRLFHEFLPFTTRKQLAAFYTRPVAGEILAALAVDESTRLILDPACGSGTLLVSAYRRKVSVAKNPEHQAVLREIYGTDIMPFAAHLAALNLTLQDYSSFTDEVMISVGNSLELGPGKKIHFTLPMFEHEFTRAGIDYASAGEFKLPAKFDAVIMNPPYTDIKGTSVVFWETLGMPLAQLRTIGLISWPLLTACSAQRAASLPYCRDWRSSVLTAVPSEGG